MILRSSIKAHPLGLRLEGPVGICHGVAPRPGGCDGIFQIASLHSGALTPYYPEPAKHEGSDVASVTWPSPSPESIHFLPPPHPALYRPREKEDLNEKLSSSRDRVSFSAHMYALSHKLSRPTCLSQFNAEWNYEPVFIQNLIDFRHSISIFSYCCL